MRTITAIVGILLVGAVAPQRAAGQVTFGAALSWGDDTDLGLGGRLNFGLGEVTKKNKIEGRATIDFFFPNGFDYWQITGDGIYQIPTAGAAKPYVGAGLGYAKASIETMTPLPGYGAGSDLFLNLIGGLRFEPRGNIRPFAEARFQLGDGSQLVLAGGIYFGR